MRTALLSNRIRPIPALRHLDDEDLVAQAKRGNEQAFTELWGRHGERIRGIVGRIIRNREDTEDLLQEVYLKSFVYLDSFKGDSLFSTWLCRIGINLALMLLRRRRIRPEVHIESSGSDCTNPVMEVPDRSENIETSYFREERIHQLRAAIERLPPQLRRIVELQNRDELSLEEIAHRIGISVGAVKARLVRARMALRDLAVQEKRWKASPELHRRPKMLNRPSSSDC
jgi:RNA polymerase sigma-70 factor, ECF subfamily